MYRFIYLLTYIFVRILFPCKIIGRKNFEKKQPAIIVCNHLTNIDPVYLFSYFYEKKYMFAKKELFSSKFKSWLFKCLGAISVDREGGNNFGAMKFALKTLRNSQKMIIFPEGTRNKENTDLQEIKSGAGVLAVRAKVPILPMKIEKRGKIFKRNKIIVGKSFELTEFYDQKLDDEKISKINAIITNKLKNISF